MSQIITNADGSETEVFTAEELEAQRNEAVEQYKIDNPDRSEEADVLQSELAEAQKELDVFKNKDLNFANLRAQKDAAEKKVEAVIAQIDEKIGLAKKEVLETVLLDHYNETLNALAGDDKELAKRLAYHYKESLSALPATKEEVSKKLADAWALATKPEEINALNTSVISSGGVSRSNIKSDKKFTEEEKEFAQKLADAGGLGKIEDKDFNK